MDVLNSAKAHLGAALLSIFEHVYVINLPTRDDRRKEIERQLARIGLSFDNPAVTLFPASRPLEKGEFPTVGTRGCYESHMAVMADAKKKGCMSYLVLEDDADLSIDFEQRIEALAVTAGKTDWDVFYGWTPETYGQKVQTSSDQLVEIPAQQSVLLAHFVGFKCSILDQMIPYIEAIYHRPAGDPQGGAMHFDGALAWFRASHPQIRTFATVAPIAVQRPSRSDIHSLKWYDRSKLLMPLLSLFRRMKARFHG